jgi:hypothetical protein
LPRSVYWNNENEKTKVLTCSSLIAAVF